MTLTQLPLDKWTAVLQHDTWWFAMSLGSVSYTSRLVTIWSDKTLYSIERAAIIKWNINETLSSQNTPHVFESLLGKFSWLIMRVNGTYLHIVLHVKWQWTDTNPGMNPGSVVTISINRFLGNMKLGTSLWRDSITGWVYLMFRAGYSLWPNTNAIWQHGSGSTLKAPSHYLNRCWLIIKGVLWHSPEINFTRSGHELNL